MARVGDGQWPVSAVESIAATDIAFGLAEIRQDVVPVPTLAAECFPLVVITGMATDVAHGIDRTGAADHLSARPPQAALFQVGIGGGVVIPVDAFLADQLGDAGRHVYQRIPVFGAGFQQQHADFRVLAQTVGQHATGGSGTHDDVIVHI